MKSGFVMANTRMKMLASAVLFCAGAAVATSAMSTDLFGGGATLPAVGYVGANVNPDGNHDRLTTAALVQSDSLFGAKIGTGNTVQYCQTGSGAGKKTLEADASMPANGVCGNFAGTVATTGFAAPSTAATQPNFAASDAPLAGSEYSEYVTNRPGNIEPVQFPAVVGSIAIVWHNSHIPTGTTLALTDAQVCGVFEGTITDWHQLFDFTGISGVPSSLPINVVFRSDGSGTSFSLTNHLVAACGLTAPAAHFTVNQTFLSAITGLPLASSTSKTGVSGNPAVVTEIQNNDLTFGYAETANTLSHPGNTPVVNFATVNGFDPQKDLGDVNGSGVRQDTYTIAAGSLNTDKVISDTVDPTTGAAVLVAQATPAGGTGGCLNVVDPNTYANRAGGYPIVAVSYLMGHNVGNTSTNLTALRNLFNAPYSTSHAGVNTIGRPAGTNGTGYAWIGGTGLGSAKTILCVKA